jgi:DNA polymerase-3 subunit epsilon
MFAPSVAFVDLETTGADPAHDRITEIGVVKVVGGTLDHEWSSLVDPQAPIPPAIQRFTGITDAMVATAPRFVDLADDLLARLEGSLFVAHNARFDLGFLRSAFRRLGIDFQPEVLCTVRLSRALYPQERRHGLDALIARHGLHCEARHRALGDARVLWRFAQLAQSAHEPAALDAAVARAMRGAPLPPALPARLIDDLPEAPGAFALLGEAGRVLRVGHGASLRAAVIASFTSAKGARRLQQVSDVRWQRSAGEFGARLLAARFATQAAQTARSVSEACLLSLRAGANEGRALDLLPLAEAGPAQIERAWGPFRNRREAINLLRRQAPEHRLCLRRLGLDEGRAACAAHAAGTCLGACIRAEPGTTHDARLVIALGASALRRWPFAGPIGVRETDVWRERSTLHVFDRWCHLGSVEDESAFDACLAEAGAARFDAEVYRLLWRQLEGAIAGAALVDLSARYGATGWKARDT